LRPSSVITERDVCGAMHNWPSVVRVRECLAGRDIIVSLRTSDSWVAATLVAPGNQGCQVHGVSSNTLVRLASGLDVRCVKKHIHIGQLHVKRDPVHYIAYSVDCLFVWVTISASNILQRLTSL
jgi:hypothetical protein